MLHEFAYLRPASLEGALDFLATNGESAIPLCGGTDLLVNIRAGLEKPDYVVDLKGIPELHGVDYSQSQGLTIGACATVNDLIDYPETQQHYPILVTAGRELATHQLRNRATVIGNVVTASPCGDMTSPLLCHGASITLESRKNGSRTLPISEFITGVKTTQIAADEIVTKITVPPVFQDAPGGYKKLKRIKGHDLGLVAVAMVKPPGGIRVAVSSAAPTPVLLADLTENDTVETIQEAAQNAISPIDDVRCTKEYRRFMVNVFIERLMKEVQR